MTGPASLARVAELVREFHDLTAGTPLVAGCEVVCHNDLAPQNTVYRDAGAGLRPVAFIDWDIAAPGARIHDLAHVCWQYVGLGPGIADATAAGQRMRLICDAYGLGDTGRLVDAVHHDPVLQADPADGHAQAGAQQAFRQALAAVHPPRRPAPGDRLLDRRRGEERDVGRGAPVQRRPKAVPFSGPLSGSDEGEFERRAIGLPHRRRAGRLERGHPPGPQASHGRGAAAGPGYGTGRGGRAGTRASSAAVQLSQ